MVVCSQLLPSKREKKMQAIKCGVKFDCVSFRGDFGQSLKVLMDAAAVNGSLRLGHVTIDNMVTLTVCL